MQPTVLKFGGTSVHDDAALLRLANIVRSQLEDLPVVVVSAMRGVTDALLTGTRLAREGHAGRGFEAVEAQISRYSAVAAALLPEEAAGAVDDLVARAALEISDLLRIISLHPGTFLPLQDEIVSYGERLSASLVAEVLRSRDIPGVAVDARRCIVTSEEHTQAAPLPGPTDESTRAALLPLLESRQVPVLGGFIGSSTSGATTTLGRGGSDYTAALVGAAVDSREIQIWTDVTGFLTADPRVASNARPIDRLSYAEAAELALSGAKVLHPKTIQPAVERAIPVRVCNSHFPTEPGTRIDAESIPSPLAVKAIAHKPGITIVQVISTRMLGAHGFLRALFEVFDRNRTAVDVVSTSEVSVSLSVEDARSLPTIVEELRTLGTVRVESGYAIISVVGEGLQSTPGIPARVFGAISDLEIALISQGASDINLTCVIREEVVNDAVRRLHDTFFGG
ncbi:MAG: aspartate kinase [Gemmatimonadetes bacterium]|nr:aspartate kinase [Gemmatimonadota bacterium]